MLIIIFPFFFLFNIFSFNLLCISIFLSRGYSIYRIIYFFSHCSDKNAKNHVTNSKLIAISDFLFLQGILRVKSCRKKFVSSIDYALDYENDCRELIVNERQLTRIIIMMRSFAEMQIDIGS